ncbi:MAG TPA: hypothetical protein VH234_04035 [Candidatus Saccharimonadales bacterium]|jgi:hypothetical protein|nr:hypothetical protein [Candidatus Saccharimonadales bacterium]
MTEANPSARYGSSFSTKKWFIHFVDSHLPEVDTDDVTDKKFSFNANSELFLPAGEMIVQRFVAVQVRNVRLTGFDGSTLLGITHSPDDMTMTSVSPEQIESEFNVSLNGNPIPRNTSKVWFTRTVLWHLTADESIGGLTDHTDRSRRAASFTSGSSQ